MCRRLATLAISSSVVAGCAGPSTVETSVRDGFVDCMTDGGITVEDVEVGVRDGRHIETFSWESVQDEGVDEVGQECEDKALRKFQVGRT